MYNSKQSQQLAQANQQVMKQKLREQALRLPVSNLPFHTILETQIQQQRYGQITVNVEVRNGVVQLPTLSLIAQKHYFYDKYLPTRTPDVTQHA